MRKSFCRFCLIIQSLKQLEDIYGATTSTVIADLCDFKFVLRATDPSTQEYFSKLVGTFEEMKISRNVSKNPIWGYTTASGMSTSHVDKRIYIKELQGLQRQINFLKKAHGTSREPSIERAMDILRNSQDKLYSALAQHGVTAEDVYKVIMENSDKALVKDIMQLQKAKDAIQQQLAHSDLSPEKIKSLKNRLAQKSQEHIAKWDEIINSPNRKELINKIEQAQKKQLAKEDHEQEKTLDIEPEHI